MAVVAERLEQEVSAPAGVGVGNKVAARMENYLQLFSLQRRFCQGRRVAFAAQDQCTSVGKLPADWQNILLSLDNHYLLQRPTGTFGVAATQGYTHEMCNLSLVDIEGLSYTRTASDHVQALYSQLTDTPLQVDHIHSLSKLSPGQCVSQRIVAMDIEPEVATRFTHQEEQYVRWLQDRLPKPQDVNAVAASAPDIPEGPELCLAENASNPIWPTQDCPDGTGKARFSYSAVHLGESRLRTTTQLPFFAIYNPLLPSSDAWFNDLRDYITEYAADVRTELIYETRWKNDAPLFELGARLWDPEQLVIGVEYGDFPALSIYRDDQSHIPRVGRITRINGSKIYSIYGLLQILDQHGHNYTAGINEPVKLEIETCAREECELWEVYAGLRLNPAVSPPIDTSLTLGKTFVQSMLFNSSELTCASGNGLKQLGNLFLNVFGSNDLFSYHDSQRCQWELELARGYQYQNNYQSAEFASFAGALVTPISILARGKTVSTLLGIQRKGSLARLLVIPSIEAMEGMAWEINGANAMRPLPPQHLAQIGAAGFSLSFVLNAALDAKP